MAVTDITFVCDLGDLDDPGTRGFDWADTAGVRRAGFVVRRGGRVFAYEDSCPHTGAPLAWMPHVYLDVEGAHIQCALHGALFTPESGRCVYGPCAGAALMPLPVELRGGRVFVRVADVDPQGAGLG